MNTLIDSKTIPHQDKTYGPRTFTYYGEPHRMVVTVRHDDRCKNGHNSFSITADIFRMSQSLESKDPEACGCLHDEIAKAFPELVPLIQWHLTSTDGPMHYIANTLYWVEQGKLEHARNSAVWPEAELEDFTKEKLLERLPTLLQKFRIAVTNAGLEY